MSFMLETRNFVLKQGAPSIYAHQDRCVSDTARASDTCHMCLRMVWEQSNKLENTPR
jgi:hypothetical protein